MSLISGVLSFDSEGRIKTVAVADYPAPLFNGGTPVTNTGELVINQDVPTPPPGRNFLLKFDDYSNGFVRGYWTAALGQGTDIFDGSQHKFIMVLKTGATNPGGVNIPDTTALRAMPGIAWFDNDGNLGKLEYQGADVPNTLLADWIDAGNIMTFTAVTDGGDGHPKVFINQVFPPP